MFNYFCLSPASSTFPSPVCLKQQHQRTNNKAFRSATFVLTLNHLEIKLLGSLHSQHGAGGGGFSPSLWPLLCQPVRQSQGVLRSSGPIRGSQLWQGRPNIWSLDHVLLLYAIISLGHFLSFLQTMFLQGEGVAYRGRILVELSTKLDQKADKAVDSIHSDDILVVQVSEEEQDIY